MLLECVKLYFYIRFLYNFHNIYYKCSNKQYNYHTLLKKVMLTEALSFKYPKMIKICTFIKIIL